MEKITIELLAQKLNLSKSTISRAFRDSFDINPKTKQRILEAAKELDFEPNSIAKSLREKKTQRIGVIIPSFTIPFYAQAICGIQEIASKEGYTLLICQSDESYEAEMQNVKSLLNSRVDGIIMSLTTETTQYKHILQLHKKDIPVVLFNRIIDIPNTSKVLVDDYDSSYKMTEYLISRGYKNIIYIAGPKNLMLTSNRLKGFRNAMYVGKIELSEESIFYGDFSIESGFKCAEEILRKVKPDAIFCSCDNVAFGVIKYLKKRGISVPGDIAVAGYTDEPFAALIDPALTTIRQPIHEIGETAAQLLIKKLKYPYSKPEVKVLPTELIIREST